MKDAFLLASSLGFIFLLTRCNISVEDMVRTLPFADTAVVVADRGRRGEKDEACVWVL
jgi:hypothetical protein